MDRTCISRIGKDYEYMKNKQKSKDWMAKEGKATENIKYFMLTGGD